MKELSAQAENGGGGDLRRRAGEMLIGKGLSRTRKNASPFPEEKGGYAFGKKKGRRKLRGGGRDVNWNT